MKYTPFLFSIIAIVCVIGTFTHVMVKKQHPQRTFYKRASCGTAKNNNRNEKKIL